MCTSIILLFSDLNLTVISFNKFSLNSERDIHNNVSELSRTECLGSLNTRVESFNITWNQENMEGSDRKWDGLENEGMFNSSVGAMKIIFRIQHVQKL